MVKTLRTLCVTFAACAAVSSASAQGLPTGYICVKKTETVEFSQKPPTLYENFRRMASLPLSGRPLHKTLTDPAHNMSTCMSPPEKDNGGFSISYKAAIVGRNSVRSTTALHESFYAGQYIRGSMGYIAGGSTLTLKDNIVTDLLIEATAAAYPFLTAKEARHAGLDHPQPYIPRTLEKQRYKVSAISPPRKTRAAT